MLNVRMTICAVALLAGAAPALAQDDPRGIDRRLDRIEQDIQDLSRQVYTGSENDFVAGREGAPSGGGMPVEGDTAARLQSRIDAIEQSLRNLTGQVEQMSFELRQTRERLDLMDREAQFRAGQLPGSAPAGGGAIAPAPSQSPVTALTPSGPQPLAPSQGMLGSIGEAELSSQLATQSAPQPISPAAAESQVASAAPITPSLAPAGTDPKSQFDSAMQLMTSAQYDRARDAFAGFVQQHPQDTMAGQAQYWVGETYFVQKDFTSAARAYAESLKTYPDSGRGPDAMLKLGLSLINLGKKDEGCATLAAITGKYPKANEAVKGRATRERRQAACG